MTKIKVLCGFKERAGGPWFEYAPGWVLAQGRDSRDYDWPVVFDSYKYHVAVENHIGPHHWTEKLVEDAWQHVRRGLRIS